MRKILFVLVLGALFAGCGPATTKEINDAIFGGYSIGRFIGLMLWACIGAFITVQFTANSRDPKSTRTPVKFSWRFWFFDNTKRVTFVLVCIATTLRFSQEITGREVNEFWALVIGLSFDLLAILLNNLRLVKFIGTAKSPDTGKKEGS